ncbi:MAG: hypothetical protein NVV59_05190 [Chitinophagaceae bacterium]|nr:hypothetical protein [Chitinophagaceae bacterium]
MHNISELLDKAASFGFLSVEEGVELYHHAPLTELMLVADGLRKQQVPHGRVDLANRPQCQHHQCVYRQL